MLGAEVNRPGGTRKQETISATRLEAGSEEESDGEPIGAAVESIEESQGARGSSGAESNRVE